MRKYVVGELQEDLTTPSSVSRTWNLLNLPQSARPRDDGTATPEDYARWRSTLSSINDLAVMQADPVQPRAAQLSGAREQKVD